MSRNLEEEAKWWASDGKVGNPPDNNEIVEGPSPRELLSVEPLSYSTNVTRSKKKRLTSAPVAPSSSTGASKTKKKYVPLHKRKGVNRNSLNTETSENSKSTSNKYAKSKHRNAAIRLLRKNFKKFSFKKISDSYIELRDRDFGINCDDVHIHVYNNMYTGSSAGIRFRFDDNTELQYNIGDGGGRNGFYLVFMDGEDKEYWKVSNELSLSQTINALLVKLDEVPMFRDSKCQQEIISLNDKGQLGNFLQNVINAVEIAAGAYQNPMAGLRGGKRKTRKRKRKGKKKTHKKRKTRKRKTRKIIKRKTRRKRKTRKR